MADEQSAFGKFIAAITSMFRNKQVDNSKTTQTAMHKFTEICAVLAMENITSTDGVIALSVQQVQAIEDALNASKQRETDLQAEVKALRKAPADSTTQVIDTEKHSAQQKEKSYAEQYVDSYNGARKLLAEIGQ